MAVPEAKLTASWSAKADSKIMCLYIVGLNKWRHKKHNGGVFHSHLNLSIR
jgi:hypothetical protein